MEYKYKAFISYRHIEPDMHAAERLQKILEAYKPPKSLGKNKGNWRIFRDVSELQSSSDLSEIIKNAIESSEYLIVICSPQYTESKWCMQELTRFRELHDNKNTNIITLLVNGDPQSSFPDVLTYTEVTATNENGETVTVREEVEPLAANIVADTRRESMKKLKTESLRIAAPLLGCDFNDLFQREKRREAARRRLIFGGVSGVLSLISVISVAAAVTIHGKNRQIQKQNDQIIGQNDQIKAQNAEIESKNSALLIENSRHLAVESENLFIANDLIPAMKKAVAALPAAGENKPVLPEAEYALSRELGMFDHTHLAPRMCLKHECAVEQLSFMGGGRSIVSTDATGVYFWNAETGELIRKISADDDEFASDAGGADRLTACFDICTDKTGISFTNTSSPGSIRYDISPVYNRIYDCFIHAAGEDEPGTGGDVYIYNADSDLWRINGATGAVKWCVPGSENAYSYHDIKVYEDYVLRIYLEKKELPGGTVVMGDAYRLEMIDCETGRIEDTVKMDFAGMLRNFEIKAMHDGVIYIYEDDNTLNAYAIDDHTMKRVRETEVNYPAPLAVNDCCLCFCNEEPLLAACSVSVSTVTDLTRCNPDMTEQKWSVSLPVNYMRGGQIFLMPGDQIDSAHDVLAVTTNRTISFVDYETGRLIRNLPIDGEITDISFSRNGLVMFTLKNGEEYLLSVKSYITGDDADNRAYRLQTFNTNFSLCSYSRGKYVTAENFSNTAYIQYPEQNARFREIDTGKFMYDRDVISVTNDGTKAAVVSACYPDGNYNSDAGVTYHLFLFDSVSGECKELTALENHKINSAVFTDSNQLIVNAAEPGSVKDKTMCINPDNGKAEEIKGTSEAMSFAAGLNPSGGGAFYLDKTEKNIVFVSSDGIAKTWAVKKEGASGADRELLDKMYAFSGCKAAMYAQFNDGDGRTALIVHDFSADQDITLDCDTSTAAKRKIQRIFWQNPSAVGVFFNDRTVSLFDADTGSLKCTVSLVGTSQEPVSVAALGDDTFAVLCRDSNLYEMNYEGFTGRSCCLDFAGNMNNNIFACDSSSASLFEIRPASDKRRVCAVWEKSRAWVLDTAGFAVRYRIDSFAAAPPEGDMVYISDFNRNKTGLFPLYTTQQLLEDANAYLSALGEECGVREE